MPSSPQSSGLTVFDKMRRDGGSWRGVTLRTECTCVWCSPWWTNLGILSASSGIRARFGIIRISRVGVWCVS